jgi:hypothetical protein
MAGLSQIAFLGGGGLSGIIAAALTQSIGLRNTFAITGAIGLILACVEIARRGRVLLVETDGLRST